MKVVAGVLFAGLLIAAAIAFVLMAPASRTPSTPEAAPAPAVAAAGASGNSLRAIAPTASPTAASTGGSIASPTPRSTAGPTRSAATSTSVRRPAETAVAPFAGAQGATLPGTVTPAPARTVPSASAPRRIYTGVSIRDVPWDLGLLNAWEQGVAGKAAAIVHFWVFWKDQGAYQPFARALFDSIRNRGSIPMVTWAPEDPGKGTNQPGFRLIDIINGQHDAYITKWAADAKAWGKPFFLRWAHEPDGDWFPWGEDANGNERGQYAQAWRHVHDLFTAAGATNVTWVWCPNVEFANSPRSSYASLYPGNSYVDWSCLDGYNWGDDFPKNGGWSSFHQIFRYAYDSIVQVAPNKPMMLGEWASSEAGGSKAAWLRDAFGVQIPTNFPRIDAVVWYNQTAGPVDWRIESSRASIAAFRAVMANSVYRGAEYRQLSTSPIPAP